MLPSARRWCRRRSPGRRIRRTAGCGPAPARPPRRRAATGTRTPSRISPRTVASDSSSEYPVNSVRPCVQQRPVHAQVGQLALARLGIGPGPLPLLLHQPAELVGVDRQPGLGGHLQRQVDREALGVVQHERGRARAPRVLPDSLVSWPRPGRTASSRTAMVRRNACSSATATRWIRAKSVASSGYDGLIRSRTTSVSAGHHRIGDAQQPGRLRTVRRSSRRST